MVMDIIKHFKEDEVRIQIINNQVFFCASDVGSVLGLSNVYRQIKDFEKGVHTVHTPTKGGDQSIIYISEPNLYRLIFKSRKENAKAFQNWIFDDVIPSIRKTGKYNIPERLTAESKQNRKYMTDAWKECGINKKHHFIQLTLQEYKAIGLSGKKKKDMTKGEILLLSALESMEALNLFNEAKNGYYECKDSLYNTGGRILELQGNNKDIMEVSE